MVRIARYKEVQSHGDAITFVNFYALVGNSEHETWVVQELCVSLHADLGWYILSYLQHPNTL